MEYKPYHRAGKSCVTQTRFNSTDAVRRYSGIAARCVERHTVSILRKSQHNHEVAFRPNVVQILTLLQQLSAGLRIVQASLVL